MELEPAKVNYPTGPSSGCAPVIFDLIINSELAKVTALLQDELVDVNEGDEDELTALHLAVELENEQIIKLLLEAGAKVNKSTLDLKLTPLHIAVRNGSTPIADCLLANGADINCKNKIDHTPLHVAVSIKNIEMTRLLLFWGADANLRTSDPRRESALLKAATISSDLTKLLLESGANLSPESKELHVSILANKPDIANIILDHLSEPCQLLPNRIGRTPLQSVASHVQGCEPAAAVNLMRRLIDLGDDVNYVNQFGGVFHILISRCVNNLDPVAVACFEFLLTKNGRNCDKLVPLCGTPLTLAFKLNQFYFAKKLIRNAFVNVSTCRLDEFRFTAASADTLKLLFNCGYRFSSLFKEHNKPSNFLYDGCAFEEMCQWLEEAGKEIMSLKGLTRIFIRNKYRENTPQVLRELDVPHILTRYVLFAD